MAGIAEREAEKVYKDGGGATVRVLINATQRRYERKPGESA